MHFNKICAGKKEKGRAGEGEGRNETRGRRGARLTVARVVLHLVSTRSVPLKRESEVAFWATCTPEGFSLVWLYSRVRTSLSGRRMESRSYILTPGNK